MLLANLVLNFFTFLVMASLSSIANAGSIYSTYESESKTICFVGPTGKNGEITWQDCSKSRDTLIISRNLDKDYPPVSIRLHSIWTNGHECHFEGAGKIENKHVIAIDPEMPKCELSISFKGKKAYLHLPPDCTSNFCGARGAIDGEIFIKKSKSTK